MALSRERIADELLKMLALDDPTPTVRLMLEQGIFKPVLPEVVEADRLAALVVAEQAAGVAPDALRRLAAILPADQQVAERVAARLKTLQQGQETRGGGRRESLSAPAPRRWPIVLGMRPRSIDCCWRGISTR
jgi:poly(A) polymerase